MSTATIERCKFTPPQVATMWGVSSEKILGFIRAGELVAINVASPGCHQRPRYLVDVRDLKDFEESRRAVTAPKKPPQRRRRRRRTDDTY